MFWTVFTLTLGQELYEGISLFTLVYLLDLFTFLWYRKNLVTIVPRFSNTHNTCNLTLSYQHPPPTAHSVRCDALRFCHVLSLSNKDWSRRRCLENANFLQNIFILTDRLVHDWLWLPSTLLQALKACTLSIWVSWVWGFFPPFLRKVQTGQLTPFR